MNTEVTDTEAGTHQKDLGSNMDQLEFGAMKVSRKCNSIMTALGEIQTEMMATGIQLDGHNEIYDSPYATLPHILRVLGPLLNARKVVLCQPFQAKGVNVEVTTILFKDDEYVTTTATFMADNPFLHAVSSAVTYGRRISLLSLLGLAPGGLFDDDGNAASAKKSETQSTAAQVAPSGPATDDAASVLVDVKTSAPIVLDEKLYSKALNRALRQVKISDGPGCVNAKIQIAAFKLSEAEEQILSNAITARLKELDYVMS